jgi:hypothetical protein
MIADYDRAVGEYMIDLLFVGATVVGLIEIVKATISSSRTWPFRQRFKGEAMADFCWKTRSDLRYLSGCRRSSWTPPKT